MSVPWGSWLPNRVSGHWSRGGVPESCCLLSRCELQRGSEHGLSLVRRGLDLQFHTLTGLFSCQDHNCQLPKTSCLDSLIDFPLYSPLPSVGFSQPEITSTPSPRSTPIPLVAVYMFHIACCFSLLATALEPGMPWSPWTLHHDGPCGRTHPSALASRPPSKYLIIPDLSLNGPVWPLEIWRMMDHGFLSSSVRLSRLHPRTFSTVFASSRPPDSHSPLHKAPLE